MFLYDVSSTAWVRKGNGIAFWGPGGEREGIVSAKRVQTRYRDEDRPS